MPPPPPNSRYLELVGFSRERSRLISLTQRKSMVPKKLLSNTTEAGIAEEARGSCTDHG